MSWFKKKQAPKSETPREGRIISPEEIVRFTPPKPLRKFYFPEDKADEICKLADAADCKEGSLYGRRRLWKAIEVIFPEVAEENTEWKFGLNGRRLFVQERRQNGLELAGLLRKAMKK